MRKRKKLLFAVLTCLMIFACGAITVFAADGGKEYVPKMYSSFWALVPPIVAIGLALITKEVYSSLFVGIAIGGIFWSNFHFEKAVLHIFEDGIVGVLTDSYNMGILVFLVILGIMVCMMNNAGGSAAFGRWASIHIKTRVGAQLATIVLGILIFIDDYFNCLTVGSVMRPITDKHNVSRAKLAYLIDATAAPVCIIAPISSWAAAVTGFVKGEDGFSIFMRAIPYNYYALLTILAMVLIVALKIDYGPMKLHEDNAVKGDIYTTPDRPYANAENEIVEEKGKVIDLVFPILILIIFCICGMLYTGGFFSGTGFVKAFSASDASVGLMLGSFFALVVTVVFYALRKVLKFRESMQSAAGGLLNFLPAIIFLVGCFLAFATGTSWGTFGILIPIVVAVFQGTNETMMIISISACMAGAVCGDHCSPISDTTIMASAGAQCNHVNHVTTQLPYAATVAVVSCITYVIAGFVQNALICLPIGMVLLVAALLFMKKRTESHS